jgi:hypothetical protein
MAATPPRKNAIATDLLDCGRGSVVGADRGETFFVFVFPVSLFNGSVVVVHWYRSGVLVLAQSQSGAVEILSHRPVFRSISGMAVYTGIRRGESGFAHLCRANLFSKNRS